LERYRKRVGKRVGKTEEKILLLNDRIFKSNNNGLNEKMMNTTGNILFLSVLLCSSTIAYSQLQIPTFPGGETALRNYLNDNIHYPDIATKNGIQGTVIVKFVVNKTGAISLVQIERGIDPYLDEEATRVVQSMPNWIPGTKAGSAVNILCNIPISFKLTDNGDKGAFPTNAVPNEMAPVATPISRNRTNVQSRADLPSSTFAANMEGYIIAVEDDRIYLKLHSPNIKVSDVVSVFGNGRQMTDPRTGQTIRMKPETVGQVKIIAVENDYSIGKAMSNITLLEAGMSVRKETSLPVNGYGEVAVLIAPAEINWPNNYQVDDGSFAEIISATLMKHLLKSNKIQLLDRSVLETQRQELNMANSGEIDFNTALQYGKIMGGRYIIKLTMQKPDVVNITNSVPLKGLVGMIGGRNIPNNSEINKYVPRNVQTTAVKVSVGITARVVDLQTGAVQFMCNHTGEAKGKPSHALEFDEIGSTILNSGDELKQTVTGAAIENAFMQIGPKLNGFFNGKL
jgi:TonB family protein